MTPLEEARQDLATIRAARIRAELTGNPLAMIGLDEAVRTAEQRLVEAEKEYG